MTDDLQARHTLQSLALALQAAEHEQAIRRGRDTIFGTREAWRHNAGDDWHDEDDDSYLAFENCQHPNCVLVRQAALEAVAPPQEPERTLEQIAKDVAREVWGDVDWLEEQEKACGEAGVPLALIGQATDRISQRILTALRLCGLPAEPGTRQP